MTASITVRDVARLRTISRASADAPPAWDEKLKGLADTSCDACLRAKAKRLHSQRGVTQAYRPGDLVSFDVFASNVPHRAGGQKYVMGFIDAFSSRRKLFLMANKSDAPRVLEMYLGWCAAPGCPGRTGAEASHRQRTRIRREQRTNARGSATTPPPRCNDNQRTAQSATKWQCRANVAHATGIELPGRTCSGPGRV